MKKLNTAHWGWGFYIDLDGNLRDVFPKPVAEKEKSASVKARPKRHVKKKLSGSLAIAR